MHKPHPRLQRDRAGESRLPQQRSLTPLGGVIRWAALKNYIRRECCLDFANLMHGLGESARDAALMNSWRCIPISNGKTFCKRYDMLLGEPRNVRSDWPTRDAPRRYEPITALGRSARCGGSAYVSSVPRRTFGRTRSGCNPGNQAQRRTNSLRQPQPSGHRRAVHHGFLLPRRHCRREWVRLSRSRRLSLPDAAMFMRLGRHPLALPDVNYW